MSEEKIDFIMWLDSEGRAKVQFEDGTRGTQQDGGLRGSAWAAASQEADDMSLNLVYYARLIPDPDGYMLSSRVWSRAMWNKQMGSVDW